MNCLHCGKPLIKDSDIESGWHSSCINKFFDTKTLPELDLSKRNLLRIGHDFIKENNSVPGVQEKISLHLSNDDPVRLTVVDYPSRYILKPQSDFYDSLPEWEHLCMQMAKLAKINVAEEGLIQIGDYYAYITKRFDRRKERPTKLAVEDFAQLSLKLTEDKYKGSCENCFRVIDRFSDSPGIDKTELFQRILFSFITGNSDMHLKNYSLLEKAPRTFRFDLSPAYDLLPVNIILPADKEETALTINGKKRNLRRNDFLKMARTVKIPETSAKKMIDRMVSLEPAFIQTIRDSFLSLTQKDQFEELLKARINRLK